MSPKKKRFTSAAEQEMMLQEFYDNLNGETFLGDIS